jgi:hypothetical protein
MSILKESGSGFAIGTRKSGNRLATFVEFVIPGRTIQVMDRTILDNAVAAADNRIRQTVERIRKSQGLAANI